MAGRQQYRPPAPGARFRLPPRRNTGHPTQQKPYKVAIALTKPKAIQAAIQAGPARPRSPPYPRPRRARARTAASCRRGAPTELGRRVASMRQPRRALVGHQERPAVSASTPAAICASPLALSPSLSLAQQQQLRRAPSPPTLGASLPASSDLLPPLRIIRVQV